MWDITRTNEKGINTERVIYRVPHEREGDIKMLKKHEGEKTYQGISLPLELVTRIEMLIADNALGYNSRTEFIKEAVRMRLDEIEEKVVQLERIKKALEKE